MRNILISCLLVASVAGSYGLPDKQRIIGGINVDINEHPHQVSLRLNGQHFCGGSIIGDRHILTAAHCVVGTLKAPYTNAAVFTGSSMSVGRDGKSYKIKTISVHSGYLGTQASLYVHDVAVIALVEKIQFDGRTKKISLASREVVNGESGIVTGWGIKKFPSDWTSPILQKAQMQLIPSATCSAYLGSKLHQGQVCAFQRKGVGACSGDSGGPLTVNNEVYGIASWVVPCGEGYPDVYTKVYAYKHWILSVVART